MLSCPAETYTAFEGDRRIARGALRAVAIQVKHTVDLGRALPVLVFGDDDGAVHELDLRGSLDEVLQRLPSSHTATPAGDAPEPPAAPRGPGRPRLGVVAREVTLLPRHWDWLAGQPGGASVALRKLVDAARRQHEAGDAVRRTQERAYRFMVTMAGHAADFEEASRALFAGNGPGFAALVAPWPADVRDHLLELAAGAFTQVPPAPQEPVA